MLIRKNKDRRELIFEITLDSSFQHCVKTFSFGNHQNENRLLLFRDDIGNAVLLIGNLTMIRADSGKISYESFANIGVGENGWNMSCLYLFTNLGINLF